MFNEAQELKKRIEKKHTEVDEIIITKDDEGVYLEVNFKGKSRMDEVIITLSEGTIKILSFCGCSDSYSELDEVMNIVNRSLQFIKLYRIYEYVFAEASGIYTDSVFVENAMLLYDSFLKELDEARKKLNKI